MAFFMQPLFRGKGRIPYKTFVGFLVDLNTYTKRTFRNQMTFRQKQFPRSKGLFNFHVQNAFPLWNFLGLCDQMHFYCLFFSYSFILLPIEPSWFNFDGKKNVVSEQILIYVSLLLIFYLLNFSFRPVKFWMWNLNDS